MVAVRGVEMPAAVSGDGRFVRSRADVVPAYVQAHEAGRLRERAEAALDAGYHKLLRDISSSRTV